MYADDSGKKDTSMLLVGGYLALSAEWELLQKKWMAKVQKLGLKEFKRSNFDLKKFGHKALLEFVDIIGQHAIAGFGVSVDCDAWKRVATKYAMELYYLVPFSLCARTCVAIVRDWCRLYNVPQDHMAYIFDKGSQDYGEFTLLLQNDLSEEVRDVTPIPENSERIGGLQCADFLACETRKQFLINSDPRLEDVTPELAQILKGRFLSQAPKGKVARFEVYREADIQGVCQAAKIPLISEVPNEIWAKPKPIRIKLPTRFSF
jgi:hypothetical protein